MPGARVKIMSRKTGSLFRSFKGKKGIRRVSWGSASMRGRYFRIFLDRELGDC